MNKLNWETLFYFNSNIYLFFLTGFHIISHKHHPQELIYKPTKLNLVLSLWFSICQLIISPSYEPTNYKTDELTVWRHGVKSFLRLC
jgi:hypothetical protein